MTLALLKEASARLTLGTGALSALGLALQSRVDAVPLETATQREVDAVLDALGVRDAVNAGSAAELRPILGEIRVALLHGATLLSRSGAATGWRFDDAALLQAAGDTSIGFAMALKNGVIPQLDGLAARFDAGGHFLDVGVGVAGLAIALASLWPTLHVTGIDPLAASIAIARRNVARAELGERITLREQAGEDLADTAEYDLAWVPSVFIPGSALDAIFSNAGRSLKPGGWLLVALGRSDGDPLQVAYHRLRTVLWGGNPIDEAQTMAMMTRVGFTEARRLAMPPTAPIALVAARAPA